MPDPTNAAACAMGPAPRAHAPPRRTLTELGFPSVREVVDKDADAVLDEVEAAIYDAALQILRWA